MVKHKMVKPYMECARSFAKLSRAKRKQVGAVAITPQDVMIYSWNGRPSGDDHICEIEEKVVSEHWGFETGTRLITHPEVLHAESNIVAKAAREGISLKGANVYVTLSPCLNCALQLYQAGVSMVTYDEEYRITEGIDFLRRKGIHVEKFEE